ncbi:bestrophin-like domain [Salinispora fenicalii]|uniref:bestrophin-like domain n=1 Tax=Salinispora fenicalii TaxID=1137263 RepID=UPI0004839A1D|nr:DUF4239 domain-containing protein [Salinispora fenicalii]
MRDWSHLVPGWALFLTFLTFFVGIAVLGALLLHGRARRTFGDEPKWLNFITHTIMISGTFYALLLALTAFSAYGTYTQAGLAVATEAADLSALYRTVSKHPEPARTQLQGLLRAHVDFMVDEAWPAYQRGNSADGELKAENNVHDVLLMFNPKSEKDGQLNSLALSELEKWSEARQLRYTYTTAALPTTLWFALLFGALVVILLSCLIPTRTRRTLIFLVCAVATMVSLLLFVVEGIDEPFRGSMIVSVDPYLKAGHTFN